MQQYQYKALLALHSIKRGLSCQVKGSKDEDTDSLRIYIGYSTKKELLKKVKGLLSTIEFYVSKDSLEDFVPDDGDIMKLVQNSLDKKDLDKGALFSITEEVQGVVVEFVKIPSIPSYYFM